MKYTVVIEEGPTSYGAYVPDLPGWVAVADSIEEVSALIREVVVLHREMLTEDGLPIPEPKSSTQLVEMQDVCRCYNSCSCVLHSGNAIFKGGSPPTFSLDLRSSAS